MAVSREDGTTGARAGRQRRHWTAAEKIRMVEQTYRPGTSVSRVALRYKVSYHLLRRWRQLVSEGLLVDGSNLRCALCGEWFGAARPNARFCSTRCRQKAYRRRKSSQTG